MLKSKVQFMNGGRVNGYHYVTIEGTDFVVCEDGHPDFVLKFDENKKGENKARRYNAKMNRQLRELQATPPEPQHGREPEKVKPLAQYLDEYIEHEYNEDNIGEGVDILYAWDSWRELLEQALDAYESTEQVKIRIEKI